ncbi:MAG: 3-phosphoshikimate 1-carboxyvinyltransferase, partial [Planctomycetota bacterium]|nr:3-phosphoshikimate 1-carboxyvinyltransferase [Planctomycetota bacterium]
MTESYRVRLSGPVDASVRPPGSKSITNRALICAALAHGKSILTGALQSDDTRVMLDALRNLGFVIDEKCEGTELQIIGCSGAVPAREAQIFVGNSGTTIRFLTAMLATTSGSYRLTGVARMHERPIADL